MSAIVKGPYLQWPTQDSMTIMWETAQETDATVLWYETERVHSGLNGSSRTVEESERVVTDGARQGRIHRLTLEGLEPETDYHYRVRSVVAGGVSVESDLHALRTAPRPDTPFSFAVISETGGYGDDEINRRIFAQIERYRPDFLLVVGDAVSRGSHYEDWARFFFGPARRLLHSTAFYLVPGNHEEDADWFYDFVSYPKPKNYYSFDYGNAHFTGLDSTRLVDYAGGTPVATSELEPGAAQPAFLDADLGTSTARWKIVFFHYPPYVSGDYQVGEMRALCPVLEQHGVNVVFNSHTIVYERSHPIRQDRLDEKEGTVYIVAGGAGAKGDWFHPKRAWHTAEALAVPHFVHAVVAGDTLALKAVDLDGRLFDSLTLSQR